MYTVDKQWYVEEGRLSSTTFTIIHSAECQKCRQGTAALPGPYGKWSGPFASDDEATAHARKLTHIGIRIACKCMNQAAHSVRLPRYP